MKKGCIIGKTFPTNNFGEVKVLEKVSKTKVLVAFEDTGFKTIVYLSELRRGRIADKLKPTYLGVGILGDTKTREDGNNKHCREYYVWTGMLTRCYDENYLKLKPTYIGCKTSDNFKEYSFFYKWCSKQIGFNSLDDKGKSFALDKDIIIKGNKVYSEDTCCFVPQEINSLLISNISKRGEHPLGVSYHKRINKYSSTIRIGGGTKHLGYFSTTLEAFQAYKQVKESYIKEVAEKWKDQIDARVYEALMNWKVEITD